MMKVKSKIALLSFLILLITGITFGVLFLSSDNNEILTASAVSSPDTPQTMVNTVIFVRFRDDSEWLTPSRLAVYEQKFNYSPLSVQNYWNEMSFGQLNFETRFVTNDMGGSFRASRPRAYFMPRYRSDGYGNVPSNPTVVNPVGYDNRTIGRGRNARPHVDQFYRRQSLLVELFEMARPYIQNTDGLSNPTFGNQGRINSITFIFGGSPGDWADMLWPHQFELYFNSNQTVMMNAISNAFYVPQGFWNGRDRGIFLQDGIDRVRINSLNPDGTSGYVIPQRYMMGFDSFNFDRDRGAVTCIYYESNLGFLGVHMHETAHILGIPDLYNYENHQNRPFGRWDLMDSTMAMPQTLNTFFRYEMGWIDEDNKPWITESGTGFELTALATATADDVMAFRIASPVFDGEFFVVEFRSRAGTWDSAQFQMRGHNHYALPGEGLLVYRVDRNAGMEGNRMVGNMHGPPNMLEVMRGGHSIDHTYLNGTTRQSIGDSEGGRDRNRTMLSYQGSSNRSFRNWNSQIVISNVTISDDGYTLTFDVNIPTEYEIVLPSNAMQNLLTTMIPFCGNIGGDIPPWGIWGGGALLLLWMVALLKRKKIKDNDTKAQCSMKVLVLFVNH
ncbi:MAG: hypothetical protein FWC80_03110 [Firmicutes bacterium]|nr:hypothetical protein [Bacillota bacterium]